MLLDIGESPGGGILCNKNGTVFRRAKEILHFSSTCENTCPRKVCGYRVDWLLGVVKLAWLKTVAY